ncbi:MAG: MBL fold metallo-hydrolase [Bacteroidota bacterium]
MTYLFNKQLPFIKENYPGNHYENGQFISDYPREQPSLFKVLQWQLSTNPQKQEKKEDRFVPHVVEEASIFGSKTDQIVWLGHASFLIRIGGKLLLTDPCLKNLPFMKRRYKLPFSISQIKQLDYILFSHAHRDHYDTASLKEILWHNPNVSFLLPLKQGDLLKKLGNYTFQEAGWFQVFDTPSPLKITFLPALHWNKRGLNDLNETLWGSMLIENGNTKIYFAGDTGYAKHFKEIRQLCGEMDICLMPVGAYKPSFMMKSSHVNPAEAVDAFHELEGKVFIPMHYGTYDLADEPPGEPVRLLRKYEHNNGLNGKLKILDVGEHFLY